MASENTELVIYKAFGVRGPALIFKNCHLGVRAMMAQWLLLLGLSEDLDLVHRTHIDGSQVTVTPASEAPTSSPGLQWHMVHIYTYSQIH